MLLKDYIFSLSLYGVAFKIELKFYISTKKLWKSFFFLFFTFSTLKWTNKNIIFPACSYNILNSHKKRAMKSKLIEFKIRDFFLCMQADDHHDGFLLILFSGFFYMLREKKNFWFHKSIKRNYFCLHKNIITIFPKKRKRK